MRIEDTAGNVTYTFSNCDCGLTGGCEKCQPIFISRYLPPTLAEKLPFYEASYPKFVREQKVLIDDHPEWRIKYLVATKPIKVN